MIRSRLLLVACIGLLAPLISAQDLRISYEPVWYGVPGPNTSCVIRVQNIGPDTDGTVTVTSSGYRLISPLELPSGTTKDIKVFGKPV